jgi:hypothetical protein
MMPVMAVAIDVERRNFSDRPGQEYVLELPLMLNSRTELLADSVGGKKLRYAK